MWVFDAQYLPGGLLGGFFYENVNSDLYERIIIEWLEQLDYMELTQGSVTKIVLHVIDQMLRWLSK